MALMVQSVSAALGVFLFGLCLGLGWFLASWLVSKLR